MLVETFSTKFYQFDNLFKRDDILINILNELKKKSEILENIIPEKDFGPTYKTNYQISDLSDITLFNVILDILNRELDTGYSARVEFVSNPWYAEYGPHDNHEPHIHDQKQINIMEVKNAFKYSCIINLSMIGETCFLNPNYSSDSSLILRIPSNFGRTILFPSNLIHWTTPHRLEGRIRGIISFNCLLYWKNNANV